MKDLFKREGRPFINPSYTTRGVVKGKGGLLLSFAMLLIGCIDTPQTTEISVMKDNTDSLISKPDTKSILNLFDLNNEKYSGNTFRFTDISDVSLNKTFEESIEPENKVLSNEFERDEKINAFKNQVAGIIANSDTEASGKKYSSVFVPMANELNRLSKSKARKRIAIIYSDLMENEKDFSFYGKKTFALLKSGQDSVKTILEKKVRIEDLTGLNIFFIYQPATPEKDRQFRVVSAFYRNLLEEHGATVAISANLPADRRGL